MRIPVVAMRWLQALLVLTAAHAAALAAPPGVRVVDGRYELSILARDTAFAGSGPSATELAPPLHVTADGDIYLGTSGRGVIQLRAGT